jgi:hypothetical protein
VHNVRQLASSMGSTEAALRQLEHSERCKDAGSYHDNDDPMRRSRQAQADSWESGKHAHVLASIPAADQRALQVQRMPHNAARKNDPDSEDLHASSASSPPASAVRMGGGLAAVGLAASSAGEAADWGPVSAMVGAIDALHAATGLPWWATFAGTALGEFHSLASCSHPSASLPDVRSHAACSTSTDPLDVRTRRRIIMLTLHSFPTR